VSTRLTRRPKFGVIIECSGTLLDLYLLSTFDLYFTSERLTAFPPYLYQKGKRALHGDLRSRKFSCLPSHVVYHTTPSIFSSLLFSSLSLFFGFKRLNTPHEHATGEQT